MIFMEERHLKMVHGILKKYPSTFYAYGSRTKGTHKKHSDLDLCFTEPLTFQQQGQIDEDFEESDLPFRVDVIDYQRTSQSFLKLIENDFVLIQSGNLFQKIEHNLIEKFCYLPQKMNFDISKTENSLIINSKLQTSLFNIACLNHNSSTDFHQFLDQCLKIFQKNPFSLWFGAIQIQKAWLHLLNENRFVQEHNEHAMALLLSEYKMPAFEEKIQIQKASHPQDFLDFADLQGCYDEQAGNVYKRIAQDCVLTEKDPLELYVGYSKGKPCATGSLFFTDSVAGIWDIFVPPENRGKGFGSQMMCYLLTEAKRKGAAQATLTATGDSNRDLYAKIGFQKIGNFHCFERVQNT